MTTKTTRTRTDEHFIVTGAGTGIGRAVALRLAQEGARLTLLARNAERLAPVAEAARSTGAPGVFYAACDIRDAHSVTSAFDAAAKTLGPFHALVANSGIGGANPPGANDRFFDIVQTNLVGTYRCVRAFERHLADGPDARHVVIVSSILARIGVAPYTGYCAAKAGLLGLVRALAVEYASRNIQANAICPGWVNTDMAWSGIEEIAQADGVTREEALRSALSMVPLGRMSEPEDIAGVVSWLTSPDARGTTGQGIDVNNGAFMA